MPHQPKILLTGGGTGGHITPILAVAHEIKRQNPHAITVYVGERGGKFDELTSNHQAIDEVYSVSAGKLRRYHGEAWFKRLVDVRTNLLNFRDLFRTLAGIVQAWRLLGNVKPDVVFQKGGFVGVPVGLAAAMRQIPLITHDSDTVPGLANRIVSRWATVHATALPAEYYTYPSSKVLHVGVLVGPNYRPVDEQAQRVFKQQLHIPETATVLLITGGSSGAVQVNQALAKVAPKLLDKYPELYIIHQAGKGKAGVYGDYKNARLQVLEFMNPMYVYSGAADVIVGRAGATFMAEFGVQGKACIIIPSPYLTGGHQVKNARLLQEKGAAMVVTEDVLTDSQKGIEPAIETLLQDNVKRTTLAKTLQSETITDAAHRLAVVLLERSTLE